jgi:hypothetical protein
MADSNTGTKKYFALMIGIDQAGYVYTRLLLSDFGPTDSTQVLTFLTSAAA